MSLLTFCVVLAVIRAVVVALAIATLLALLVFFATRPRETLLFMVVLVLTGLATAHPVAFIVMLGAIGVAVGLSGVQRTRSQPRLLNDGGESH